MQNQENIFARYHRQMILKGFGKEGQEKLNLARVLVVGAGGLGCPALLYLVAAGVATIGIVDHDKVSLSNLHRQVLYSEADIGHPKVSIAAKKLQMMNEMVTIIPYETKLTVSNCLEFFSNYDIILDGSDNFPTRYLINDACVLTGKPLVYGAVSQYDGQVAVFNVNGGVNYRDLFPTPPKDGEVLNCAESGVLGVLPGIIGSMQANETIKLITGIGESLVNRLYTFNALTMQSYDIQISANPLSAFLIPPDVESFTQKDYDWECGIPTTDLEIDHKQFDKLLSENITVIDVRNPDETPFITSFDHQKIPLSILQESFDEISGETVVFICQSGKRSLHAAQMFREWSGSEKNIFSLKGGILNYETLI